MAVAASINYKIFIVVLILTFIYAVSARFASNRFKGMCFSDNNCDTVCKTEGVYGGHCSWFKCYCDN
uniref:Knottin scorpion toxin-like domain-containing protein n=1 Tax=Panagrolaimus sp. PS1159 TaxID=55785 RepID=A0AC35GXY3_9BILA